MNPDVAAPPKRVSQRRGLARPLIIFLAAVLLPIVAFAVWDRIENRRLMQSAIALHIPDEVFRGYPQPQTEEQKRASHLYSEADRLANAIVSARVRGPGLDAAPIVEALETVPADRVVKDPRLEKLREIEAPFDRALALFDRATALDARGFTDDDLPEWFVNRSVVTANALRTARLVFSGDAGGASSALLATLRFRRVFLPVRTANSPTLNSLELLLTRARPFDRPLEILQQEYAKAETEDRVQTSLELAGARLMQMMDPAQFGDPPWAAGTARRVSPLFFAIERLGRPFRARKLRGELEVFQSAFAAAAEPWPERLDALRAFDQERQPTWARRRSFLSVLVSPVPPGYAAHAAATEVAFVAEALARDRVSISAIAVARYQRAHGGALPSTLGDLVPVYLKAPPLDPYTGRELYYRRDADGFTIYSAGSNRKDDGGVWYVMTDLNLSRRGDPKDIGIRVPRASRPSRRR